MNPCLSMHPQKYSERFRFSTLRGAYVLGILTLFAAPFSQVSQAKKPPPDRPVTSGKTVKQEPAAELRDIAKGISCKDKEQRCTLKEETLDRILGSNLIVRSARLVPAAEGGVVVGFKLFAIRPGSLFTLLGLRNGDLVRTISGQAVTGPEQALAAYAALRSSTVIPVELTRDGAPLTMTYEILRKVEASAEKKQERKVTEK